MQGFLQVLYMAGSVTDEIIPMTDVSAQGDHIGSGAKGGMEEAIGV